ncbi:hypothetical protein BVRB_2g043390 [Beta vulgaris subsp. vulgaris]|nr:hypothetical protein BVRB_2g043390 [Beta vulgaris subsp. vulgaris]
MTRKTVVLRSETRSTYQDNRVNYRECQRNHAANTGGYAVDGCREFISVGAEGTDLALVCATCGCHRNFHRREVQSELQSESSHASS